MSKSLQNNITSPKTVFWGTVLCAVFVFAMGGTSRADAQSLIILRPFFFLAAAVGLYTLTRREISDYRALFVLFGAVLLLTLLHLVPLPYSVWSNLPGRQLVVDIDKAAGLGQISRPLTLAPWPGRNALFSLIVPAAALIFAVQLGSKDHRKLLNLLLGIGVVSLLLGIVQVIGPASGPLYLYRITNFDAAVGLFANRNHNAVFLSTLIPMLAAVAQFSADQARLRRKQHNYLPLFLLGVMLMILIVILIIGSRAGFLCAIVAVASVPFIYNLKDMKAVSKEKWFRGLVALIVVAFGAVIAMSIFLSKAESLTRAAASSDSELRLKIWPPIADIGWQHFPFGSGIGSFVETYKVYEPSDLLSHFYLNHAHNDFLEVWMTAGLPGVLLIVAGLALWALYAWRAFFGPIDNKDDRIFARLGVVILLIFILGSVGDYPVRVPSIVFLFTIASVWSARGHLRLSKA